MDEDIYDWDVDRTLSEIKTLMPVGWTFKFEPVQRTYWACAFWDAEGHLLWQENHPAANILLFTAYWWIKEKVAPHPKPGPGSNWVRRRPELTLQAVNADALRRTRVPDPEDVDPTEIAAVYDSRRNKYRR